MLFPGSYKHIIFSWKLSKMSTALNAQRNASNKIIIHYYDHHREFAFLWCTSYKQKEGRIQICFEEAANANKRRYNINLGNKEEHRQWLPQRKHPSE